MDAPTKEEAGMITMEDIMKIFDLVRAGYSKSAIYVKHKSKIIESRLISIAKSTSMTLIAKMLDTKYYRR